MAGTLDRVINSNESHSWFVRRAENLRFNRLGDEAVSGCISRNPDVEPGVPQASFIALPASCIFTPVQDAVRQSPQKKLSPQDSDSSSIHGWVKTSNFQSFQIR